MHACGVGNRMPALAAEVSTWSVLSRLRIGANLVLVCFASRLMSVAIGAGQCATFATLRFLLHEVSGLECAAVRTLQIL